MGSTCEQRSNISKYHIQVFLWITSAVLRRRGGTERALLLQVPSGTEEGEVQWNAACGKRPCKPWTLRFLSSMGLQDGNLQGTLHIHSSATDRAAKTWAGTGQQKLSGRIHCSARRPN